MAIQRSRSRRSSLKKSRKFRDLFRKQSRRLHLEQLEDRRLMAVFVLPNNGALLTNGETRTVAPKDLTFRFTDIPGIDPTTINDGIRLVRAGHDGAFGQANDVVAPVGFIGLGDTNREVVMRFAEALPDDTYQITIVGSGATPLKDISGAPFNGGVDVTINFRLDLGAQVVAVVPQPIRRLPNGSLSMTEVVGGVQRSTENVIHVYFNEDDLDPVSAERPEFYRLYITKDTLDPADDTEILPMDVDYDPAANLARLTFSDPLDQLGVADGSRDPIKSFRLRIGTDEVRRSLTTSTSVGDPGSSFASAFDVGTAITAGPQGASAAFAQQISPTFYNLIWPGSNGDPGDREIPAESHLLGGADTADGIPTIFYNFKHELGTVPDGIGGRQPAFNLITENQKQRAREIFELYTKYSGVQFVESESSGLLVATGDMRVLQDNIPTGPGGVFGLAGGGIAIMDNAEVWNDSYGANWFQVAMHEIGHLLGQGHTYDLPPLTIQGSDGTLQFNSPGAEPVFPGDNDIVHMRHMHRPDSRDIDMYRFVLDSAGVFTVEAFAERLSNSSSLDTTLRLYRQNSATGAIEEIARNDDYFSKDSLIHLDLAAGTYFVGVSASGNDQYDPAILDTGIGGTTQGAYEIKFDFRKTGSQALVDAVTPSGLIADTLNVPLDGDADGIAGGVFNFWFRAAPLLPSVPATARARTIFVDKRFTGASNGLITAPYKNIDDAMAAASEYDIVRIVGNGGADGNLATLNDNLAYQIGFNDFTQELPDGPELTVKKNVTVMIDAGAIFQMRRSQVSVGSTAPSIFSDRSGGALQVLGTPNTSVYFTSYDELDPDGAGPLTTIGLDENPLSIPPREGNWGGLSFRSDLDRADGRFDHETVGVFLNYVNYADIRYGGGQVNVNSVFEVVTPINMVDRRPTITNNLINLSADAAMSANPDSFEETNFQAPRYWPSSRPGLTSSSLTLDYDRVGPDIHGNRLLTNTTNGLFVRTRTPAGNVLEEMTIAGRFDDTDIVHIVEENLVVRGTPGGPTLETTPPPVSLIILSIDPLPGNFAAGTTVEYILTYVDLLGNEGRASAVFPGPAIVANNSAVRLIQLPDVASPNPEFVARRLYRSIGSGPFVLVDQIPASVSEYVDRNVAQAAIRELPSLVQMLGSTNSGQLFSIDLTTGFATPLGFLPGGSTEIESDLSNGTAYVQFPDGSFQIQQFDPATGVALGPAVSDGASFNGLEFVGSVLYGTAITGSGGPSTLRTLNPATGVSVVIGPTGVGPVSGLAFHVPTQTMYGIAGGGGPANLYTINLATGAATVVGNTGFQAGSLEFGPDGNLYAGGTGSSAGILFRINPATGASTLVGVTGFSSVTGLTVSNSFINTVINRARLDASLVIDPSIVIKSDGARIDVNIGANLLAEGFAGQEIVFTSLADDRYGAGGTFDTNSDNQVTPADPVETAPQPGDWGGIFFSADAQGSIDNAVVSYAGGLSRVEGTFAGFNPIEIHQAKVRITDSKFEFNDDGQGGAAPGDRFGRGFNRPAAIFVRGAQPVIMDNVVIDNAGAFININVNALNYEKVVDLGRQIGLTEREPGHLENNGPLIVRNRLRDNGTNGMIVRGGTLTTESVWDDTDIVHVLLDAVNIPDFHVFGGLRLESSPTESLVVKASGPTAGFTATGRPLEIDDRIGGIIQVLGQPGFPVVMTGLSDDTEGAGFTPEGIPQTDTDGNGGGVGGGGLPTGPEVNNGTLIDNDVAAAVVGHFEIRPGNGGIALVSGVTAQGQTQLFINQDFIFDFLNFVDVGPSGGAIDLSTTTITTPPTLLSPDLVFSEGTFAGANGPVNWRVETSIANGTTRINNTLILNSATPLGALRFVNYLDEDVLAFSDDLLYRVGSPGQSNFRLFTLDNAQRIGFSQGGTYVPGPGLVSATYDGFAADKFSDLRTAITGAGTTYSPTGNIDLVDLPAFVDPALGAVNGLADVTTAMAWTVDPLATTARITSFLELVAQAPASSGTPGEWQGIIIDEFAHDRNVETILEQEATLGDGSANAIPQKAQLMGALGPFEKGGDENLRLGLTVHGLLNSATDVDIYSFSGRTGTEVWIELDRTTHALDAVLELLDVNGNVLARSNNSPDEHAGLEALVGIARDMQKAPPFEGRDFYTTNQRDPGMRVILPGPANTTNTYFVRVRSGAAGSVGVLINGVSGLTSELVQGGTNRATQIMQANAVSLATQIEGGSGSVTEIIKGANAPAVQVMRGGGPNIVSIDGGPAQNEEQSFGFPVLPTGGTFTLTFNGQTTTPLAFNASANDVRTALEALSNIGAGDVAVVFAANIWTVTFQGALSNTNVSQLVPASNELQRITNPVPASPFTLTFDGQTSAPIAAAATATDVQAALESLSNISPGDVIVTAAGAGAWDVEFTGVYLNQDVLAIDVNFHEIQRVALAGTPTGGFFTLSYLATPTGLIAFNAPANVVQAALETIPALTGNVVVTSVSPTSWDVTFRGTLQDQDVAPLLISVNELQSFTLLGNPTGGAFRLSFNGVPTTNPIPFNATDVDVLNALNTIPALNNNVQVLKAANTWFVTFVNGLANTNVSTLLGTSNEFQRIVNPVPGGALTLSFNGQVTSLIPPNATFADVQSALQALGTIGAGNVLVTGPVGGPYVVEFRGALANASQNEIGILDVQVMRANSPSISTTQQGGAGFNESQLVTLQGSPVGGTFRLTFNGQTTGPIAFNAANGTVQNALQLLSNIGAGNVSVIGGPGNWTVTFIGALANLNVFQMTGSSNEFQRVVAPSGGGFSLIFNGQATAPIPSNATAGQVQAALEALNNINVGDVAVTLIGAGLWDVEFRGAFAGLDVAAMAVGQDEVQRIALPPDPDGTVFRLTFQGQTTAPIAFGATAADVQAALESLAAIAVGDVVVTGAPGGPWDVRFTGALSQSDVPLLSASINEVQQVAFQSIPTGGVFRLSFNGQVTGPIAFNASPSAVQLALEALSNIAPGDVVVTGPFGGPWQVEFTGTYAGQDVSTMDIDVRDLTGSGVTAGAYQLQLRLRELDELGGSTVRFAKIANAVNGIAVFGQPTHSPLAGEGGEVDNIANNTFGGAQFVGNLLNSDRSARAIAGSISAVGDVDWYSFDVQYDATQGIPGVSTMENWWSTIFDIDYADGFARPNLLISVFDSLGNLVGSSHDSNVADDQPNPLNGNDVADLSRGSAGGADPFIGPIELPQGRYFVAVSSDNRMPLVLDQFTNPNSASPLVRLEPADHVQRIVEDHISTDGGMTGSDPLVTNFIVTDPLAPNFSFIPWNLHDVTLFVSRDRSFAPNFADNSTEILTVDPFSGLVETTVGTFGRNIGDITMHPQGRLYAYTHDTENAGLGGFADATVGNYLQINTGNASVTQIGDDGIITHEPDLTATPPGPVVANDIGGGNRVGEGVHFRAMDIGIYPGQQGVPNPAGLAIGGRDALPGRGTDAVNILYAFIPDTGAATGVFSGDRSGNALLPGPNNGPPAGTQIVERAVLDTTIDAIPSGNADAIAVVEATFVAPGTGATTFQILDDYPVGPLPPEIPGPPGTPNPTLFTLTYGGPGTVFEFDAGPEALLTINPNLGNRQIRDSQGFFANGTRVEFDTGPIVNVTGVGGFANGSFLEITDVADPGTGHAATTQRFEFNSGASTIDPSAILVSTAGNPTPATMATRIAAAINGQQAAQGFTTNALILPGTTRVSLVNVASPTINPNSDSNVSSTALGAPTLGALGVAAGSVAVRIEETSIQTDLIASFNAVNAGTNPPGALMPLNTQVGVSGAIGVGRVQIGFDGTRLNLSGASTISNSGLNANVFQTVGSQGGVFFAIPARVPVPFLAQDTAGQLAQRMADAVNVALSPAIPAFASPSGNFVAPGSTVQQASVPLQTAAQAPGGTITGLTSVPTYDANGNILSSTVFCVSDAGGLFRIVAPFSTNAQLDYIGTSTQLLGIDFSGLETGPNIVEGNRYRQMLFGITDDGTLHAFNTQGILQPIFNSAFNGVQMAARSSMQILSANGTPLTHVHGLAFSTLNRNLWQATPNTSATNAHRQNDDGHGIELVVDQSRVGSPGGSSLHFGNGINLQTTAGIDSPGGSHGSMESVPFSLTRYSSADNPVLYFNYFLETEDVGHGATPMRDAIRVFIAGDDGVWNLLTTNDSTRLGGTINDDFDFAPLRVEETFDDSNNWRQARVELADFAGQDNLRIRFDFSTAGSFNMGDRSTPVNGDELRAIDAIYLRDSQNFTLSAGGNTANPLRTFEFDAGFTLVALDGAATPDGGRFTINGVNFEFNSAGGVGGGFIPVNYFTNDSSATMAQRIANAIFAAFAGVVPTQRNGNRVNLRGGAPGAVTGAVSVTSTGMPASFIEGAVGVTPGSIPVNIHLAMTRTEVREAIALVLANVYVGGVRAQIKTHNEIIRLIGSNYPPVFPPLPAPQVFPPQFGFRFVSQSAGLNADPLNQRLLGVSDFLPGDDWGAFNSNLRGQNNIIEGIYIDDIIIGLAERGEMVSGVGANNSNFTANPTADPDNIVAGAYQLEIRRGAEIGVPIAFQTQPLPRLGLLPSIDSNDRLAQTRALLAPAGSSIFDGQTFSLSDGINTLTFEFVDLTIAGSGPAQGRVRIDYRPNDTAPVVAQRIRAAINSAPVQAVIKVQAQLADGVLGTNNTGNQINLLGAVSVPSTGGLNFLTFGEQHGDSNRFRDQGQIILQGNEIRNASQWGILIDAEPRRAVDGNSSHNGPNRNLRELNVQGLVPGVVVINNVVHDNGLGGMRISGDNAAVVPDAPVPFARAVNNTFYGQGGSLTGGTQTDIGIRVDETAAPTLLNNIVANFNLGVSIDGSSQGNDRTVLGGMLFQGNDVNANVGIGSGFPIVLSNNQPLFVNASAGNFYLKALSPAIDSSVDSLLDRPSLVTVRNPLGIPPSPIISPDRDGVGQLRVDDPGVSTPQGQGLNPFKDRGAIDRVDFTGPTGGLINPPDNDAGGLDLDPAPTVVVRTNDIIRDFRIRLFDRADPSGPPEGSDVDDLSISGAKVKLETVVGATTTLLVEGVDYSFSYDATNNLIVLTPLGGLWPLSTTYRITLDNSLGTGITDRAGNPLQANQIDGSHTYTIFLGSAIDWGDAPATYPTLAANNGANHQVVAGVRLGATVGAEADGQPSANADLDPSDDGVTNIILSRGALSSFTVLASSVGKIDAWLDLDRDGVFDLPGEYIVAGFNVTTPGVNVPVSFNLPNGPQGSSILRVRFSTAGISTPDGAAADGEVEDYRVTMVGPAFNNGILAEDVNNNSVVDTIDLLIVLNFITFLSGELLPGFSVMTLPITSPPYKPTTPTFDPTGGGVPGQGRFIDVVPTGSNFGQVDVLDLLAIVNYLTIHFVPSGGGEGEAEGEGGSAPQASLANSASSGGASGGASSRSGSSAASIFPTASLFASPSIVIEERLADSGPALGDDSWLTGGTDATLELLASAAPVDPRTLGLSLADHARRPAAYGPLDEDAWDDLLDDLSLDVGGLPGDSGLLGDPEDLN